MMLDADWVYREFLRRGYRQDYAADFLDQAWKNSSDTNTQWRTAPDVYPFPPKAPVAEVGAPEALAHREAVAERLSHLVAMRYADKIELHRHTLNEAARLLRTLPAAPEGEG